MSLLFTDTHTHTRDGTRNTEGEKSREERKKIQLTVERDGFVREYATSCRYKCISSHIVRHETVRQCNTPKDLSVHRARAQARLVWIKTTNWRWQRQRWMSSARNEMHHSTTATEKSRLFQSVVSRQHQQHGNVRLTQRMKDSNWENLWTKYLEYFQVNIDDSVFFSFFRFFCIIFTSISCYLAFALRSSECRVCLCLLDCETDR